MSLKFGGQQPATPDSIRRARQHVRHLEATGLSRREIARRAQVAASSITKLANDRNPAISRPVAAKVLAVRR